ncbi:MAG: class I poly(R)-hydroxyalkanoic acid synthase, partial [Bacteroidota bacterium]
MPDTKEFTFENFIDNFIKAGQRITQNYFENFSGYNHDNRDITLTYFNFLSKIAINPQEMFKIQNFYLDFLQNQQKAWESIFINSSSNVSTSDVPQKEDKRFTAPEWNDYPYFNFIKQNYLLSEKLAEQIIDEVEIDDKTKKKLEFYNEQYIDALSPSNFLMTNPEALKLAVDTKGKSTWEGFNNLIKDIDKGRITQSDESAFEVGKNLAITPGSVIYENELMQLIQYAPAIKKVYEIPLLLIPPWINKYYILDLQPKNSFVKYLIEQGITVYMISWRNPPPGMGNLTLDDYVKEGALKAIEIVQEISSTQRINTLGYCLGGTLLSIAAAILS